MRWTDVIAMAGPAAAAFLVAALIGWAVRASGPLDAPSSARKVHVDPTPTSGGLAIAAGFSAGLAIAATPAASIWAGAAPEAVTRVALAALVAFGALALGVRDDLRPLGPASKFGCLVGAALFTAVFIARAETLPLAPGVVLPIGAVIGALGSALWVFTLINATNFVDGANGLAMGSTAIALVGLGASSLAVDAPHAATLAFCGAGALLGFLLWNFPRGRLFAGDAGSLFAGTLSAITALIAVQDGGLSPLIPPILFFPILADVLLTLWWRVKMKRPELMSGHREHLFQIGLRAGLSHVQVSVIYWSVSAHCALIAFLATYGAQVGEPPAPAPGVIGALQALAAFIAGLSPVLALVVLAYVSIKVATRIRRFAAARGLDGE